MRTYPLVDAAAVASWNKILRKTQKGKSLQWSLHVHPLGQCKLLHLPTYGTYARCEGVLLWHILKVLGFKVPTQYSWELIAQRSFKLGRVEHLVTAQAEPPRQYSSKKAHKKGLKQRGP